MFVIRRGDVTWLDQEKCVCTCIVRKKDVLVFLKKQDWTWWISLSV